MKSFPFKTSHSKTNYNKFFIIAAYAILFIIVVYILLFASYKGKISLFTIYETKNITNASQDLKNIDELSSLGRTYSDYSGLIISTEPKVLCEYKDDSVKDGYKKCVAIIEVINTNEEDIKLNNANIKVDFDSKNIKNPQARYSNKFQVVEEKFDNVTLNTVSLMPENEIINERFISESSISIDNNVLKTRINHKNQVKHQEIKFYKREYSGFIELGELAESKSLSPQTFNDTLPEINNSLNVSDINQSENNTTEIKNSTEKNYSESIIENKSILDDIHNETNSNITPEKESSYEESVSSFGIDLNASDDEKTTPGIIGNIIALDKDIADNESDNTFIIKSNEPFAIKIDFEIPEYESGIMNFMIEGDDNQFSIMSDISACGTLNTENSAYSLDEDINASGTCMSIEAKNVTLNCNGHTITLLGSEEYNTAVTSSNDKTIIKNCRLIQPASVLISNVINLAYSSDSIIENNTISASASVSAGIYLENSQNVDIKMNEINLSGVSSYGIYISALYNSNISDNNISSQANHTTGIYLDASSSFINVYNNRVIGYNLLDEGIYFENSDQNISNNIIIINASSAIGVTSNSASDCNINKNNISINGEAGYPIYLSSSDNINIAHNNISVLGPSSKGIFLKRSLNNIIFNNSIYLIGENDWGIYIDEESYYNSFSFNDITAMLGESIYGLYLYNGSNNNFSYDNILTNCSYCHGLVIEGSNNNTFRDYRIDTFGPYSSGIYFYRLTESNNFSDIYINTHENYSNCVHVITENHDFNFYNSIFNSSIFESEIYLDNAGGEWNFINVSYSNITYFSETNGILKIFYYLNLHVKYLNNSNADNINISIFNDSNGLIYSNITGVDGKLGKKVLLSYQQNNFSEVQYPKNYTIYLNDSGQIINTSFIFDSNKNIELILNSTVLNPGQNNFVAGSSGGSSTQKKCNFVCEQWSDCVFEKQTRICNINGSGCIENLPDIERTCKIKENSSKNNTKAILFDIYLNALNEELTLNDNLSVSVGLLNIGLPGSVDASINYSVYDASNSLIYSESEVVPVKTQIEFIKKFPHINFSLGNYKLRADLSYIGQTEPASAEYTFSFVNPGFKNIFKGNTILILLIILISICVLGVIIKLIMFYRKPSDNLIVPESVEN